MKKLLTVLLTALMVVTIGTVNVFADTLTIKYVANEADIVTEDITATKDGTTYYYTQVKDSEDSSLDSNYFVSKTGKEFVGWSKDNDGTVDFTVNATVGDVLNGSSSATLYAVWSNKVTLQFANIITDDNYKDVNPAKNNLVITSRYFITENNVVLEPATQNNPVYKNDFGGWYYKLDSDTSFTKLGSDGLTFSKTLFETLVQDEHNHVLTLYARWTYNVQYNDTLRQKYEVRAYERDTENTAYVPVSTFDENGVSSDKVPVTVYEQGVSKDIEAFVYENEYHALDDGSEYDSHIYLPNEQNVGQPDGLYHFMYWNSVENQLDAATNYRPGTVVKQVANQPTSTRMLWSCYEKFGQVIYHNLEKATSDDYKKNHQYLLNTYLNNNGGYTLTNLLGLTGYSFKGWYTNSNLTTPATKILNVPAELYAKWAYKVEYVDSTYSVSNDYYHRDDEYLDVNDKGYVKSHEDSHEYIYFNGETQYLGIYDIHNFNKKPGYRLLKWNTRKDGTGKSYNLDKTTSIPNQDLYNNGDVEISNDGYHLMYAVWEPISSTLSLDTNGGSGTNSYSVTYDQSVQVEVPTRTGYEFNGYYTNESNNNGTGTQVFDSEGKLVLASEYSAPYDSGYVWSRYENTTLYAKWTPITYTVIFNSNKPCNHSGHTMNENGATSITATYDVEHQLPETNRFSITGYKFKEWNTKADGTGTSYLAGVSRKNETSKKDDTVTYYAIWEAIRYVATLDSNGGSNNNAWEYVYYDQAYPTFNTSKTGYTLTGYKIGGWTVSGLWDYTEDKTMVAQWTENGYTVVYNPNIPKNASAANLPTTRSYGYLADTYAKLSNNGNYLNNDSISDVTEYALEGWKFDGWSMFESGKDGSGSRSRVDHFDAKTYTTDEQIVNVFAIWVPTKVKFTFDSNKPAAATALEVANSMNDQEVVYDETTVANQKLTANAYELKGWSFTGWTSSESPSKTFVDQQNVKNVYKSDIDITLYANWKQNDYTLTFVKDGQEFTTKTATYDSVVTAPTATAVAKDGYTFKGWFVGDTKVFDVNGALVQTSENEYSTLKGTTYVWTKDEHTTLTAEYDETEYSITYDLQGGSVATPNSNKYTISKMNGSVYESYTLTNPTKSGYTFEGWTGTGLTAKTETVTINKGDFGNRTYIANWKVNTYTITYVADGIVSGSNTNPTTYTIESNDIVLTAPSKVGYTFDGWYDASTGGNKVTTIAHGSTGNKTLYARFNANNYKVVFDRNEPAISTLNGNFVLTLDHSKVTQNFVYDVSKSLNTGVYKLNGFKFDGWNTKADGSGTAYTDGQSVSKLTETANGVVTLFAQWVPYKATITFDPNRPLTEPSPTWNKPKASNNVMNGTTVLTNDNGTIDGKASTQEITFDKVLKNTVVLNENKYTLEGWKFLGWSKTSNGNVDFADKANVYNEYAKTNDESVTLYAVWAPNTYIVYYKLQSGDTAQIVEDLTTAESESKTSSLFPVKYSVTSNGVKAVYTYDVDYKAPNRPTTATVNDPEVGVIYTKPGYHVAKWNDVSVGNDTKFTNLTSTDEGVVYLYPTWKANTYKVVFHNTSTDPMETVEQEFTYDNSEIIKLKHNVFTNTDSTVSFNGWNTVVGGTGTPYSDGEPVKNLTTVRNGVVDLYTVWNKYKSVIYVYDVVDGVNQKEDSNTSKNPVNITNKNIVKVFKNTPVDSLGLDYTNSGIKRLGYVFDGFYSDAEFKHKIYTLDQFGSWDDVDGSYVLYEKWIPNELEIVFNVDQEEYLKEEVDFDETATITNPTKDGYTFTGWYDSEGNIGINVGDDSKNFIATRLQDTDNATGTLKENTVKVTNTSASGSATLYAHWLANKYEFKYDENIPQGINVENEVHATNVPSNTLKVFGTNTTVAAAASLNGYEFKGWNTKADGTGATYQPGATINDVHYVEDDYLASKNSGTQAATNDAYEITLYAMWEAKTYTVEFNGNNPTVDPTKPNYVPVKSVPADKVKTFDTDIELTSADVPTREGYIFLGWSLSSAAGSTIIDPMSDTNLGRATYSDSKVVVYAQWKNACLVIGYENENGEPINKPFEGVTNAYVDGQPATLNENGYVIASPSAKVITVYEYANGSSGSYPTSMKVYKLLDDGTGNKIAKEVTGFENLLTYAGTSIRLTGNKGIRIKTTITNENREKLTGEGLEGYIAVEYGTIIAWKNDLPAGNEPTIALVDDGQPQNAGLPARKGRAYAKGSLDQIFEKDATKITYTNVFTGSWTKQQCEQEFSMRSYIILRPVDAVDNTQDIVIYGGTIARSIKNVASQALAQKDSNGFIYSTNRNASAYYYLTNNLGGSRAD